MRKLTERRVYLTLCIIYCTVIGPCQMDDVMFERMFLGACVDPCLSVQACVGVQMVL